MVQHTDKEEKEWKKPQHENAEGKPMTPEEAKRQLGWDLINENNTENSLNNRCPR